jgi:hypothetical protein
MLAAPLHGFAFLSTTKSGSTAIEQAFEPYAQVVLKGPPRLKHATAASFHRHIAPLLAGNGWGRDTYEVVTVVREPLDWLASWWRYRSRDELRRTRGPQRQHFAGDLSFTEWVSQMLDRDMQGIGRFSRFVSTPEGEHGVDRMWRYEHLDACCAWMGERVGKSIALPTVNVSPPRSFDLTPELQRRVEEYFAPEYELYEHAL